jgi:hypothetical protein
MAVLPYNTVRVICEAAVALGWYGFWSITVCCLTTLGVTWIKARSAR